MNVAYFSFSSCSSQWVVIATEKKLPALMDDTSVQKIAVVTERIGMVYSGMGPDFRVLLRKARKKAEQYHRFFKDPIPVTILVQEVANIMQEYTQSGYALLRFSSFSVVVFARASLLNNEVVFCHDPFCGVFASLVCFSG